MQKRLVKCALVVVLILLLSPIYLRVVNGPAFKQRPDQVVVRQPGKRFLGQPQPAAEEAKEDLDFALLSQAAYQRKPDAKDEKAECYLDPDSGLKALGWHPWENFPNEELQKKIAKSNLRVEVWQNERRGSIAVTFGGTVFTNPRDWMANIRWFLPGWGRNDEYTDIVTKLGPAFVNEFLRLKKGQDQVSLNRAEIFATGHSLGGGLAQQFAYSLPTDPDVPRVKKVFAFDPSPVTGFYSVAEAIRKHNSYGIAIDRIYERGEILAILRSLENFFYPPSAANPAIRQIRYYLSSKSPIAAHSISELACGLKRVAGY